MSLPIYTNPAEAPDWMQTMNTVCPNGSGVVVATINGEAIYGWPSERIVVRVLAPSRPHPWPESKQMPPSDYFTKRFEEVK